MTIITGVSMNRQVSSWRWIATPAAPTPTPTHTAMRVAIEYAQKGVAAVFKFSGFP